MHRPAIAARTAIATLAIGAAATAAFAFSAATAVASAGGHGGARALATGGLCEGASATVLGQTHAAGPLCINYSQSYVCAAPNIGVFSLADVSVLACAPA